MDWAAAAGGVGAALGIGGRTGGRTDEKWPAESRSQDGGCCESD